MLKSNEKRIAFYNEGAHAVKFGKPVVLDKSLRKITDYLYVKVDTLNNASEQYVLFFESLEEEYNHAVIKVDYLFESQVLQFTAAIARENSLNTYDLASLQGMEGTIYFGTEEYINKLTGEIKETHKWKPVNKFNKIETNVVEATTDSLI